jgi:hypothetical protein
MPACRDFLVARLSRRWTRRPIAAGEADDTSQEPRDATRRQMGTTMPTPTARLDLSAAVLKDAYRANPGRQRVTIRADRDSRTRHVVAVMDACNQANIRNYSLATE